MDRLSVDGHHFNTFSIFDLAPLLGSMILAKSQSFKELINQLQTWNKSQRKSAVRYHLLKYVYDSLQKSKFYSQLRQVKAFKQIHRNYIDLLKKNTFHRKSISFLKSEKVPFQEPSFLKKRKHPKSNTSYLTHNIFFKKKQDVQEDVQIEKKSTNYQDFFKKKVSQSIKKQCKEKKEQIQIKRNIQKYSNFKAQRCDPDLTDKSLAGAKLKQFFHRKKDQIFILDVQKQLQQNSNYKQKFIKKFIQIQKKKARSFVGTDQSYDKLQKAKRIQSSQQQLIFQKELQEVNFMARRTNSAYSTLKSALLNNRNFNYIKFKGQPVSLMKLECKESKLTKKNRQKSLAGQRILPD